MNESAANCDSEDDGPSLPPLPEGTRNYMTPLGHRALCDELDALLRKERPAVVETVAWAASNGDRSENGDYIYGKKRLREIDRRIRFLTKRLERAEVVEPAARVGESRVFFGATVVVENETGGEESYTIVGIDEADARRGRISWISPLARALMKQTEGDVVRFPSPSGIRELEVVEVRYEAIEP